MYSEKDSESAVGAKKALRSQAISRRESSEVDSRSVCRSLESFLLDNVGGSGLFVVVFDGLDGEVDLSSLWEPERPNPAITDRAIADQEIAYAITRTPTEGMALTVHPVSADLEHHRWGYRQPVAGSVEVPLSEIGAVLVPGLAFDLRGGRLGWGAGYYDRFLSRVGPDVLKIGISDGNIVDLVPTDTHDVSMTHIAMASGVLST